MRVEKDLCNEIYKLNTQILSENFVLIIILIIVYIFLPKRHSSLQRAHKKSLLKKAATAEARQVDGIPQASASLGSPAATASTNTTDHATDDVTTWTANVATEATTTTADEKVATVETTTATAGNNTAKLFAINDTALVLNLSRPNPIKIFNVKFTLC